MRSGRGLDTTVQDAGDAVRGLARRPGFTLAAVTMLALAIGATTAVYSLVYGVLLRPLPFRDADRLVPQALRAASIDPARVLRQE